MWKKASREGRGLLRQDVNPASPFRADSSTWALGQTFANLEFSAAVLSMQLPEQFLDIVRV
jgi:hypothetical protein